MRLRNLLSTLAISSVIVACVSTNAALMDTSIQLARTCPEAVKIFSTPATVPGSYTEIALLNSSGSTGFTNEQQMIASMRTKASEVGANGLIMGNIDEPGAGAKVAAAVFGTGTERKGKSVAIFIAADTARSNAACVAAKAAEKK